MPSYKCKCGAKYKLPETSIGKKAKCKHCNLVFVVKDEKQAAPKQIESDPDDLFADIEAAVSRSKTETATERVTVDPYAAMTAAYGPAVVTAAPSGPSKAIKTTSVATGYGHALLRALQFPFSLHNLIIFLCVWLLLALQATIFPYIGTRIGLLAVLVVSGWYCTFCFEVIGEAAGNNEDLPKISLDQGLVEDILVPLASWVGSWIVVLLPFFIFVMVKVANLLADPVAVRAITTGDMDALATLFEGSKITFFVLFYGGIALWPMVILCVAIGGFSTLARVDLIALTILRTLPAYVLTAGIYFGTEFTTGMLIDYLEGQIVAPKAVGAVSLGDIYGIILLFLALAKGVELYFTIVAFKAIGAYYHFFKDKFEWSWG